MMQKVVIGSIWRCGYGSRSGSNNQQHSHWSGQKWYSPHSALQKSRCFQWTHFANCCSVGIPQSHFFAKIIWHRCGDAKACGRTGTQLSWSLTWQCSTGGLFNFKGNTITKIMPARYPLPQSQAPPAPPAPPAHKIDFQIILWMVAKSGTTKRMVELIPTNNGINHHKPPIHYTNNIQ